MSLGLASKGVAPLPAAATGLSRCTGLQASASAALQPLHSHQLSRRHRLLLVPTSVAAGQVAADTGQKPPPPTHRQALQDPAKLVGSMKASVQVPDRGGAISLEQYMRLPTDQYSELDPQMIKGLGGSSFLLKVPRLMLFNIWVEPEVMVSVRLADGQQGVVFESGECRLRASDLLNQLGLDRRFVLFFHTMLMWQPGSSSSNGASSSSGLPTSAPAASSSGSNSSGRGSGQGNGTIHAQSDVQVWTEVIGPFRAIPRSMLEATGNVVMQAVMQALLPVFLNKLADDYRKWSTDAAYRARWAAAPPQHAMPPPSQQQP